MINDMIRRKSISWTRIFSDLEKVLPPNVRVTSIRPQVNSRDQLSLDMTVESESPESVIGFFQELEGSDVFGRLSPARLRRRLRMILIITTASR